MPRKTTDFDWLLFDADRTLLDFDAAEAHSLRQVLESEGLEWEARYQSIYQEINRACWHDFERGLLKKEHLRTIRFERFFLEIRWRADVVEVSRRYLAFLGQCGHLVDGVDHLIPTLAKDHRLAIITNGLKEVQRTRLERTGLLPHFEFVVVSDEIGPAKPQAAFFEYTADQMGHPDKSRVLVIGDSLHADIKGGQDFGYATCWYNPHGQQNRTEARPDFEIREMGLVAGLLDI